MHHVDNSPLGPLRIFSVILCTHVGLVLGLGHIFSASPGHGPLELYSSKSTSKTICWGHLEENIIYIPASFFKKNIKPSACIKHCLAKLTVLNQFVLSFIGSESTSDSTSKSLYQLHVLAPSYLPGLIALSLSLSLSVPPLCLSDHRGTGSPCNHDDCT